MQTHSIKLAEHRQLANMAGEGGKQNKAAAKFANHCRFCLAEYKTESKKKGVERRMGNEDALCTVLLIKAGQRKAQKRRSTQVCTGRVEQR